MKTQKLLLTLFAFLIISWPSYSLAQRGCCSWHGGVAGCDTSTGSQICGDGSLSPTCGCTYIPPKPVSKPTPAPAPAATTSAISKLIDSSKDTTDYKSRSEALQSGIDSDKILMQKMQSSIDDKDSQISELKKSVEDQQVWLWIIGIALLCYAIGFYNKKFTKNE